MQYNRHNEGKKFCKRAGKTGDLLFTALGRNFGIQTEKIRIDRLNAFCNIVARLAVPGQEKTQFEKKEKERMEKERMEQAQSGKTEHKQKGGGRFEKF